MNKKNKLENHSLRCKRTHLIYCNNRKTYRLILNLRFKLMSLLTLVLKVLLLLRLMLLNSYLKKLMPVRIKRMIWLYRFHWTAETTLFIWVQFTWDLQFLNQQELFSILVQSISPLPVLSVMTRPQEISNLRNTIHSQALSFKETNLTKDAAPLLMTCINLTPTKSSPKLLLN